MSSLPALPAPEDFRSIRLNDGYRSVLYQHGILSLFTPAEEAAEAVAFTALMRVIRVAIDALIPPEDMAVLRRYGAVTKAHQMIIREVPAIDPEGLDRVAWGTKTADITVCFCPRDVRTLSQDRTGCGRVVRGMRGSGQSAGPEAIETLAAWISGYGERGEILLTQVEAMKGPGPRQLIMPDLQHWLVCRETTNRAREAILHPLRGVINRAATLQTVAKVWPEAMRLAPRFGGIRTAATDAEASQITAATFMPPAGMAG